MEHTGWPRRFTRLWMLPLPVLSAAGCGGAVSQDSSGRECAPGPCGGQQSGGSLGRGGNPEGGSATGGLSLGGRTGGVSTGGNATGGAATGGAATGGTATGGATAYGGDSCGTSLPAQPIPPVVLFAFDASTSMNDTAPSTNGQSKWDVLRRVWPDVLARLPASWAVGMMTWSCPDCPNGSYQPSVAAPMAPLDTAQLALLSDALPLAPPGGQRPTVCAYDFALSQVAGYAESPRTIVLLTDGPPTVGNDCVTLADPATEAEYAELVASVAGGGITTFVVGLPGTDQAAGGAYDPLYQLSLVAVAGGTTLAGCTPSPGTVDAATGALVVRGTYCHYDLTAEPNLAAALGAMLEEVAARMATCRYEVPRPPPPYVWVDSTGFEVILTSGGVGQMTSRAVEDDCSQGGEWRYSSFDDLTGMPTAWELCPEVCAQVSVDPSASVDIVFMCLGEI